MFDALFHRTSAERLREAGLLPDEQTLADAIEERAALISGPPVGVGAAAADARRRRIAQLDDLIDCGPFAIGGRVDLDLDIRRPEGEGHRMVTTGRVTIDTAGVVYERVPYPVTVTGGSPDAAAAAR